MKKLLVLLFAAAAFAACNDDDGAPKIRYASTNDGIIDGHLQGINMFFYGSAVATDDAGNAYTDDEALFEFAGGPSGDSEYFSLYMHKTRFAAGMPPFEMKIPHTRYTGMDNSIAFSEESIVPEAILPGQEGYQPLPSDISRWLDSRHPGGGAHHRRSRRGQDHPGRRLCLQGPERKRQA